MMQKEKYRIVGKVNMFCPLCGKTHNVEKREEMASTFVKEQKIYYAESYFFCKNIKDEENKVNKFWTESIFDENICSAREAYKNLQKGERYGINEN